MKNQELGISELHQRETHLDEIKNYNQLKVIRAMQKNRLSDTHFGGTTGYGYDDSGRETLEKVYADVFKCIDK